MWRITRQGYGLNAVLRNRGVIANVADRYAIYPAVLAAVIDWESSAIERTFLNNAIYTNGTNNILLDLDLWKYLVTGETSIGIGQVRIDRALYLERKGIVQKPANELIYVTPRGDIITVPRGIEIAIGMSISEPLAIEYAAANLADIQRVISDNSQGLNLGVNEAIVLTIVGYNKGQEMIQEALILAMECDSDQLTRLLNDEYYVRQVGTRYDFWKGIF